jgi:hypothetical protein
MGRNIKKFAELSGFGSALYANPLPIDKALVVGPCCFALARAVRRHELLVSPYLTPRWESTNCATLCPSCRPAT